ncbi:MAG: tetratricopeptide repeat protein, partial [Theionarchaea archaeon]|nr:tetratricopeptide repeat protein [Theionarchaea archaeon]
MGNDGLRKLLDAPEETKLSNIEEYIRTLFKKGTTFHPFFTLHGIDHSEAVIEKLNELTRDLMESSSKLNPCEIFCLLAAAYLHDTGMLVKDPGDEDKINQLKNMKQLPTAYSVTDLIREEHHIRSEQYITKHAKELGLNPPEAKYIGKISRGHRKENLNDTHYNDSIIGNSPVRVSLLAALLRLADELDADFRRAPIELRELLEKDMSPIEKVHWIKHYCTEGIKIDRKEETGLRIITIKPHLLVPNGEYGKYIVPLVVEPIKQKLDALAGVDYIGAILSKYGVNVECMDPRLDISPDLDVIPLEIFEEAHNYEKSIPVPPVPQGDSSLLKQDPSILFSAGQILGPKSSFSSISETLSHIQLVFLREMQLIPIELSSRALPMTIYSSKDDIQLEFKKRKIKTFNVVKSRQFGEALKRLEEGNLVVIAGVEDSGKTSFAYIICEELLKKGWKIIIYQEQAILEKEDVECILPALIVIDGLEQLGAQEQKAAHRLYESLQNECSFLVTYRTEEPDRIIPEWQRETDDAEYQYLVRFESDEFREIIKVHAAERDIKISEATARQFAWRVSQFAGLPSHIVYLLMMKEKGSEFGPEDAKQIPDKLKKIRDKVIDSLGEAQALMKSFRFFFLLSERRASLISTKLLKIAFSYYFQESIQLRFSKALSRMKDIGLIREIARDIVTFPKEGLLDAVDLGLQDNDTGHLKELVKNKFLGAIDEMKFDKVQEEIFIQELKMEFFLTRALELPIADFGNTLLRKDRKIAVNVLLNVLQNIPEDVRDIICKFVISSFEDSINKDAKDWCFLGIPYGITGDFTRAKECFEKVIEFDPQNIEGWRGLGLSVLYLENYTRAKECFEKVIEFDPQNTGGWLGLGQVVLNLKNYTR